MIAAFSSTGYRASRCEAVTSEPKIGWGWCSALPRIVPNTRPLMKFSGCSWSNASIAQKQASVSCTAHSPLTRARRGRPPGLGRRRPGRAPTTSHCQAAAGPVAGGAARQATQARSSRASTRASAGSARPSATIATTIGNRRPGSW